MKIVINTDIGSFHVGYKILCRLNQLGCKGANEELDILTHMDDKDQKMALEYDHFPLFHVDRNDPLLVQAVEELPEEAPHLKIVTIPDDVDFYIYSNEMGVEAIHEKHRVWD